MKRILFTASAAFGCLSFSATAQVISQSFSFGPASPNFTELLTFNSFGGSLADLQDVSISFVLNIEGGILILDNDGADPALFSVSYGAKLEASSTDVTLLDDSFQPIFTDAEALYTETVFLEGNVGDGPGDFDPSPPDGTMLTGTSASVSGGGQISPLFWSQFVSGPGGTGGPTYNISAKAFQIVNTGSVGGIEFAVTPVTASGEIMVTYTIPEPSSALLGSIGAGLLLLRRRRA